MNSLTVLLSRIEIGILLFVVLFNPFGGKILAIVTVILLEIAKFVRPVDCTIKKDLRGKVAVITGGNTGIGKETALELARQGCTVVIGARDVKKSIQAIEQIIKLTRNNNVFQISLDLGSKASVEQFSDEIHAKFSQVHYLINNAGVMAVPNKRQTTDGFEMQIGINHLGHFYLTYKLWDLLKKVQDVRIVNVSAVAHKSMTFQQQPTIDFENFNYQNGEYNGVMCYRRTKLANVLFSQQLAHRLQKYHPQARCVSLHPGVIRTQLTRYMFQSKQWIQPIMSMISYLYFKTPKQGAQTTLFTTLSDHSSLQNGAYYSDSAVSSKNPFTINPQNQLKLWQISQKLLNIKFEAN